MSRCGIHELDESPTGFDPSKAPTPDGKTPFESEDKAAWWDRHRSGRMRGVGAGASLPRKTTVLANRLAHNLVPKSMASARYMRDQRIRIFGWLWRLLAVLHLLEPHQFTLIPKGWDCAPRKLKWQDPRKLMKRLRQRIVRARKTYEQWHGHPPDGILLAFIHGDYDRRTKRFQLHVHGIATGGMVEVVRLLRRQKHMQSKRPGGQWDGPQRVRVERKPVEHVPHGLTYIGKSYWMALESTVKANGRVRRPRLRTELPPQIERYALRWLDRWTLQDIALLIGLEVVGGKLRLT